jgi:hypothetical protein
VTFVARLLKWTAIVIGALVALLIASMVFIPSSDIVHEDARISNPSKTIDAVVLWTGGGGAAGWSYTQVYVVSHGKQATRESRFTQNSVTFNSHYPQKQNPVWNDDNHLTIHVVCESVPRASEQTTLHANGQGIPVDIVYDNCDHADEKSVSNH